MPAIRHEIDPGILEWQEIAPAEVDGRRIAIGRAEGIYFALDDTCPHAGCSLAQGELDGTSLRCLCHGSEFDVTSGAVLNGPATEPVDTFPITLEDGRLWVEL